MLAVAKNLADLKSMDGVMRRKAHVTTLAYLRAVNVSIVANFTHAEHLPCFQPAMEVRTAVLSETRKTEVKAR